MKKSKKAKDAFEIRETEFKMIDMSVAQKDIDDLREIDRIKRKPRNPAWSDFTPHQAKIIGWAKAEGGSKYKVARLLSILMKNSDHMPPIHKGYKASVSDRPISPDRIRRYVISTLGYWPNARKNGGEK